MANYITIAVTNLLYVDVPLNLSALLRLTDFVPSTDAVLLAIPLPLLVKVKIPLRRYVPVPSDSLLQATKRADFFFLLENS